VVWGYARAAETI